MTFPSRERFWPTSTNPHVGHARHEPLELSTIHVEILIVRFWPEIVLSITIPSLAL